MLTTKSRGELQAKAIAAQAVQKLVYAARHLTPTEANDAREAPR